MPARRSTLRWLAVTLALHALVAVLSPFLLSALTAASHHLATKPSDAFDSLGDVAIYFQYANRMAAGAWPYRDFTVEYPFLFLPLAALPRLLASGFAVYTAVFVVEMLAFDALLLWLLARMAEARHGTGAVAASLGWYTAFFVALFPSVLYRYDLAPTALAFAAALAWTNGQPARGGVLAGCGALLKLFPALIALPATVVEFTRNGARSMRGLLALMLTLLCGVAAWRAVPGRGMDQFYAYHAGRGIELGSLWAGLSMVLAKWVGLAIECRYDHASKNIAAAWSAPLATVTLPLQVAAVALLAWRFHRTGGRDLMRYAAATLLAFVLLGKVLSPQYLVWLMPFVAALDGRRGRQACWLFLSAALLTTSVFPVFWAALSCFDNLALALLNARNFMLLALFCVLVREAE